MDENQTLKNELTKAQAEISNWKNKFVALE